MRSVLLAFLALATAGCTAVRYYGETAGPTARLRVATVPWLGNNLVDVWAYDDDNCQNERQWFKLNQMLLIPSPTLKLDMPLWTYNDTGAKEVHVRAGHRLYLLFRGQTGVSRCGVPVVVELSEGRDYELLYDEPELGRQCSVVLYEIVEQPGKAVKVPIMQFGNAGNEGCEKAFRAFRWI